MMTNVAAPLLLPLDRQLLGLAAAALRRWLSAFHAFPHQRDEPRREGVEVLATELRLDSKLAELHHLLGHDRHGAGPNGSSNRSANQRSNNSTSVSVTGTRSGQ
jgi:hypothetical protein